MVLGGTNVPIGFVYESTQRYMTLKFHTDYSNVNTGWFLNFIASTPNATAYFNATMGTISSPNYPNLYPNSFLQFYKIVVPETKIVIVEITDFVTEPTFDYLRIIDGNNATDISQTLGLLSGNLTGNGSIPMTFYSTQSIVSLLFYTDHSINKSGWTLDFRTAPKLG
uniref:CUB domain-containing protein n=1 Tax=Panagrolaimus davidi TaxID=227884 RepID=A0A914R2R9_9BILA